MAEDADGSYLELLSQSLTSAGTELLFRGSWETLNQVLPGCGERLQDYLRIGVEYVMDKIDYVPVLPIEAEERGLKTRFPTASLTAVNLVQQILRRVSDYVMVRDPRFSEALGGPLKMDMRGEQGPWESQDCTAATDFHPQWLTQAWYEELADRFTVLQPYTKWYQKLFGPKRIIRAYSASELAPEALLTGYPRAPVLDDRYTPGVRHLKHGHATLILQMWDDWLVWLNDAEGTLTKTGQMMGDPTSFPGLMLVTLCSAEQTLKQYPYTPKERKRTYPGLRRSEAKLKGIGDDALIPRWYKLRQQLYYRSLEELSAQLSWPKCFSHRSRGLIAEVPLINGFEMPFWPSSVLVAPPGGSKGWVTWVTQAAAFGGDPSRPTRRIPKFFWKLSPYYYTWKLADRLGLPISAPEAYGGVGVPITPKRSTLHHVQWLSYLSQQPIEALIIGLGLAPLGKSKSSYLDAPAAGWVKQVLAENQELIAQGIPILSDCALTDAAELRLPIKEAFRSAVGRVRSVEFYFRTPPELIVQSAPSVRMSCERFRRKVRSLPFRVNTKGYGKTIQDLERKTSLFFVRSGGYLPDPWAKPTSCFGLERSKEVRERWKAPWLLGIG
jgi:hypothetical protein